MWIVFSIIGALADTARDILTKKNTLNYNPIASGFALNFYGMLLCIPLVLLTGIPAIKNGYWTGASIVGICACVWPVLMSYALKHDDLSNVAPLLALNPITTTLVVFILDGKVPSQLGCLGIILVFIGLYFTRIDSESLKNKGLLYPFIHMFRSISALCALGVSLCWSIGAWGANIIVHTSSPIFFLLTSMTLATLLSFFIVLIFDRNFLKNLFKHSKHIFPYSLTHFISEFCVGAALSTGFLPYVAAIKRSAIISSTLSGAIYFDEKLTPLKIFSVIITFLGVVIIILGS